MMAVLQTWFILLIDNVPALATKLVEQLYLVGLSMLIAVSMGIPLGVLVVRQKRLRSLVLGFFSILQTIPSLALLVFLLPFFGIGAKPAIVTLALYALLPIVRNTVTGLEMLADTTIEAAKGLGFTSWQRLWIVELPLALPAIVNGIRVATTISVGIATLAAFVGAGGLGDFINRGLALNNTHLLLLGAIPAALLALLLDFLIGHIEKALKQTKLSKKKKNVWLSGLVIALISCLLIFGIKKLFFPSQHTNTLRIATKNFTEQLILGEIVAQLVEKKTHLKIERRFNLGTTEICHQAILKGQIDLYPEYTGTAYLTVLNQTYHNVTEHQLYQSVKADYLLKYNVVWLPRFGFANTQAIAVRSDFANHYHLKTISDLVAISKKIIIAAPAEFTQRPDALPGLKRVYNLHFAEIKQMEPALLYPALRGHQVDAIMAFSTDGRLAKYHLVILQDDRKLFPPYDAAPLIRLKVLEEHPQLMQLFKSLENTISTKDMQALNAQVEIEKRTPAEVVHNFLLRKHLI